MCKFGRIVSGHIFVWCNCDSYSIWHALYRPCMFSRWNCLGAHQYVALWTWLWMNCRRVWLVDEDLIFSSTAADCTNRILLASENKLHHFCVKRTQRVCIRNTPHHWSRRWSSKNNLDSGVTVKSSNINSLVILVCINSSRSSMSSRCCGQKCISNIYRQQTQLH